MKNVKTNQMNACRCNSKGAGAKMTSWLNNNFKLLALTLLAVLSVNVWGETVSLTNATIKNNASGKGSYGNYAVGGFGGKYLISSNNGTYFLQLGYNANTTKSANNSHLTTPQCSGAITQIQIVTNNGTASGRTFYLCASEPSGGCASSGDYGSGSTSSTNGTATINVTGSPTQFHIYPNGTACIASVTITYSTAPSCTNKVTVTKNSATGGSYTLKAGSASGADIANGGTVDNCDANATIVVVPNANSHYHCTGVTASYSASVTGPDGSGNYTITYTQGSSISSTIDVTFAEDTKYTISFLDNIQSEEVASKEVYGGAKFTFPVLTDKTAATTGTCEQVHYHFMGWVISTHTGEITVGDIKTGTSDAVNANATYKAVWAAEEQE